MKHLIIVIALLTNAVIANAQYNLANLALESTATSTRYRYKNLQLYPIRANSDFRNEHRKIGNYLTLQDALQKKKVVISEFDNGTVNTLYIENVSNDTIMVLAGEVVKGGKQDRAIADDFLLSPKSGKKDISVFCVEHGRWTDVKKGATFNEYFSISSNKVRKAASVGKNQQDVWKKVAETVEKNEVSSSTGTLAALQTSDSLNSQLAGYVRFFETLVKDPNVIGVVAVSGDEIMGCDMFATHVIFEKSFRNLINSYATEAITSGKAVTVSYDKVNEYLRSVLDDESTQEDEIKKNGSLLKDGKRKIHISTF